MPRVGLSTRNRFFHQSTPATLKWCVCNEKWHDRWFELQDFINERAEGDLCGQSRAIDQWTIFNTWTSLILTLVNQRPRTWLLVFLEISRESSPTFLIIPWLKTVIQSPLHSSPHLEPRTSESSVPCLSHPALHSPAKPTVCFKTNHCYCLWHATDVPGNLHAPPFIAHSNIIDANY